ncbi:MAG TPA: DUF3467 domain-containing protein [Spirochaetota bacterium]|nr:DUF3467 domain-containing protein [Spirochaetota bacterium]
MKDNEMNVEIKFDEKVAEGVFSNFANITHSPEEFIVDFLFVNPVPPAGFGKLMSRIIMTPGHMKRLCAAMQENITRYEEHFGEIRSAVPGNSGESSVQ